MLANRVRELTTTSGTGDITLDGALAGHVRFQDAFDVGDRVSYVIEDGDDYEIGTGKLLAADMLERTTVLEVLVGGVLERGAPAPIALSGNARVFCAATAEFLTRSEIGTSTNEALKLKANDTVYLSVDPSGDISATGRLVADGGARIGVQNKVDGGPGHGIFLWDTDTADYGVYLASAGSGKSLAGGLAAHSIDGRAGLHARFRTAAGAGHGWLWENAAEDCLMSLTADSGDLHVLGSVGSGEGFVARTGFQGGAGSAGAPAYAFTTAPDAGLYYSDGIAFSVGSEDRFAIASGAVSSLVDVNLNGNDLAGVGALYGQPGAASMTLAGGPAASPGGAITLFAADHDTRAGDTEFRTGETPWLSHDSGASIVSLSVDCRVTKGSPLLWLFPDINNQVESGRIRMTETKGNWQGAFLHYDGCANAFHVGVHDADDSSSGSDVIALSIARESGAVSVLTLLDTLESVVVGGEELKVANANGPEIIIENTTLGHKTTLCSTERASWLFVDPEGLVGGSAFYISIDGVAVASFDSNTASFSTAIHANAHINKSVNTDNLVVSGGNGSGSGANIVLNGGDHATAARDMFLRAGTTAWLSWDDSLNKVSLAGAVQLDGQVIHRSVNSGYLYVAGGGGPNAGANILLFGGATPETPEDLYVRAGSKNMMVMDASEKVFNFIANDIKTTGRINIGSASFLGWDSAYNSLHVGAAGSLMAHGSGSDTHISDNAYFDGTNFRRIVEGGASAHRLIEGTHSFRVAASGLAGSAISWVNALSIAQDGDVTAVGDLIAGGVIKGKADTTGNRPGAASVGAGATMFDTTLNKPIWSDGSQWVDAAGVAA